MKKFTEDEKIIARNIDKKFEWMSRDESGALFVYKNKPIKRTNNGVWVNMSFKLFQISGLFDRGLFKSIKWEDGEPTRISDIYNPQILDETEREYLKTLLRPFHEEVDYVVKYGHILNDDGTCRKEYLLIQLYDRTLEFPDFDAGKMYAGMERNTEYDLDELGITYDD